MAIDIAENYFQQRLGEYILDNDEDVDADDARAGWIWAMEFIAEVTK